MVRRESELSDPQNPQTVAFQADRRPLKATGGSKLKFPSKQESCWQVTVEESYVVSVKYAQIEKMTYGACRLKENTDVGGRGEPARVSSVPPRDLTLISHYVTLPLAAR
jgi:hypothetical protein